MGKENKVTTMITEMAPMNKFNNLQQKSVISIEGEYKHDDHDDNKIIEERDK